MSSSEIGSVILVLGIVLFFSHGLAYIFQRLKQPKLVGEILAGALLGPFVLGYFFPDFSQKLFGAADPTTNKTTIIFNFIYWTGLFLLMFVSGSETRRLMAKENHRQTAWMLGVGTPLPFLIVLFLGLSSLIPLGAITGTAQQETSALLVLCIAVAVTSIPVISRIFYDLKILHTRFASLILGSAVLEDIVLWGVLAVATGLVKSATLANEHIVSDITSHVGITLLYMALGLTLGPVLLRRLHRSRWNIYFKHSLVGYSLLVLFFYISIAMLWDVNLVFAAFLSGFGLMGGVAGTEREIFKDPMDSIAKVATGFFIPIYFFFVGYKLVFNHEFSMIMLLAFLIGSSLIALITNGLAAWLAGFRGLDIVNISFTQNARGGPGIVLASVAYEAGIINSAFYTTLVITAILTSQFAGIWLHFVLSRGWPLLSTNPEETWPVKARKSNLGIV